MRKTPPTYQSAALYGIRAGYRHRDASQVAEWQGDCGDDTWQREVYERALEELNLLGERSGEFDVEPVVIDYGCGIGFKLLKYFSEACTIGYEIPHMVRLLRERHPDRHWRAVVDDQDQYDGPSAQLLICADVIEHVADPNSVMRFIRLARPGVVVLSTPDRSLMRMYAGRAHNGPPKNPAHVREWDFEEFGAYVSRWLDVKEHFISNEEQATQCVVGTVR